MYGRNAVKSILFYLAHQNYVSQTHLNRKTADHYLMISTSFSIRKQQKNEENTQCLIQRTWHCQRNNDDTAVDTAFGMNELEKIRIFQDCTQSKYVHC